MLVAAVWAHLSAAERAEGMVNLATLLRKSAVLIMSLRHGPSPAGRRVFEVSAEDTIELARNCGLRNIVFSRADSVQTTNRSAGVNWSWLAFTGKP